MLVWNPRFKCLCWIPYAEIAEAINVIAACGYVAVKRTGNVSNVVAFPKK